MALTTIDHSALKVNQTGIVATVLVAFIGSYFFRGDDLASQQRALTLTVAKLSPDAKDPAQMLAAWRERYAPAIARLKAMTEELKRAGTLDLAVLSVLLRELRALA